jgi:type II secretory pathway pseudopilin PulG
MNKNKKGFTLIETLVAITILMLTVTAIIGLISNIIVTTRNSERSIVADYLMQEGLEYMRNNRDNALNNGATWFDFSNPICPSGGYITTMTGALIPSLCNCNTLSPSGSCDVNAAFNEVVACPPGGNCPNLVLISSGSSNMYCSPLSLNCPGSWSLNKNTQFNRKIKTTINPANPDELFVNITMSYRESGGSVKTKTINQSLFNW